MGRSKSLYSSPGRWGKDGEFYKSKGIEEWEEGREQNIKRGRKGLEKSREKENKNFNA